MERDNFDIRVYLVYMGFKHRHKLGLEISVGFSLMLAM